MGWWFAVESCLKVVRYLRGLPLKENRIAAQRLESLEFALFPVFLSRTLCMQVAPPGNWRQARDRFEGESKPVWISIPHGISNV